MAENTNHPSIFQGTLYLSRGYRTLSPSQLNEMKKRLRNGFKRADVQLGRYHSKVIDIVEQLVFPTQSQRSYYLGSLRVPEADSCGGDCLFNTVPAMCPFPQWRNQFVTLRPVMTSELAQTFTAGEVPGIMCTAMGCPLDSRGAILNVLDFLWYPCSPQNNMEREVQVELRYDNGSPFFSGNLLRKEFVEHLWGTRIPPTVTTFSELTVEPVAEPEPVTVEPPPEPPPEPQPKPQPPERSEPFPFSTLDAYFQNLSLLAKKRLETWRSQGFGDFEENEEERERFERITNQWQKNLADPSPQDQKVFSFVRKNA